MSNRYAIKDTVKVLMIHKPNQKIRFQIRHPENVYAVIGIAVTCSLATLQRKYIPVLTSAGSVPSATPAPKAVAGVPFPKNSGSISTPMLNTISDIAGNLTLAIAEKGDVVFTEDVSIDNNDYSDLLEKTLVYSFVPQEEYLSGKGQFYFDTKYLITESMLEGYYEDVFLGAIKKIKGGYLNKLPYKVSVYIRYQTYQSIEP